MYLHRWMLKSEFKQLDCRAEELSKGLGLAAWLFNLMFDTTSVSGRNGKSDGGRKSGPRKQVLFCNASEENPLVPASAGLFFVTTWCHWSTVVPSRISETRFATNIGSFSREFNHWKTLVLSDTLNVRWIWMVSASHVSSLRRDASKAAWSLRLGTVSTFIGATRAFPMTKASSFLFSLSEEFTRACKNATALNTSCELSTKTCNSKCSNEPETELLSIFMCPSFGYSELQDAKRSSISFGSTSSQLWPWRRKTSLRGSRVFTVKGKQSQLGQMFLKHDSIPAFL